MKTQLMNKAFIVMAVLGFGMSLSLSARADVEAVSASVKGIIIQIKDLEKEAEKRLSEAKNLIASQIQDFNNLKSSVEGLKDNLTNPLDSPKTFVLDGVQNSTDGSKTDDEVAKDVEKTYVRYEGDDTIVRARKLQNDLNKVMGENAALLYARTLILRQELLNEKNPEHSLETIEDALQASNDMVLLSMQRWNKILAMQAYINEYNNTVAIHNFKREAEEEEDNEEEAN